MIKYQKKYGHTPSPVTAVRNLTDSEVESFLGTAGRGFEWSRNNATGEVIISATGNAIDNKLQLRTVAYVPYGDWIVNDYGIITSCKDDVFNVLYQTMPPTRPSTPIQHDVRCKTAFRDNIGAPGCSCESRELSVEDCQKLIQPVTATIPNEEWHKLIEIVNKALDMSVKATQRAIDAENKCADAIEAGRLDKERLDWLEQAPSTLWLSWGTKQCQFSAPVFDARQFRKKIDATRSYSIKL